MFLPHIYNSVLRIIHIPLISKFSIIRMIPKSSKPSKASSSYCRISLLPVQGKVLEKLLLRRLSLTPNHQFGFSSQHSTIQQCHRVVDTIGSTLELKQYCPRLFSSLRSGLARRAAVEAQEDLHSTYFLIIRSYLTQRSFQVSEGSSFSTNFPARAGVPQGSILAPVLYTVYTAAGPAPAFLPSQANLKNAALKLQVL